MKSKSSLERKRQNLNDNKNQIPILKSIAFKVRGCLTPLFFIPVRCEITVARRICHTCGVQQAHIILKSSSGQGYPICGTCCKEHPDYRDIQCLINEHYNKMIDAKNKLGIDIRI
tara:strand:- start:20 stop:364 length:345 start_codon:yes stop_codon:yes gene_type:complete